jgi:peptidoglycan glycosyltransferase
LGAVLVLCFTLVVLQLVNIQFRQASALVNSPNNPRNVAAAYDNQRGDILAADGSVLAQSVPATSGPWDYTRVYPSVHGEPASLYSSVVGYDSLYFGAAAGVEYQYDSSLTAHTQPARSLGQLLSPPPKTTDNVTLTIEPYLQATAASAVARILGAHNDAGVLALNPRTGAVEADYSNPSFDPNALTQPDVANEQAAAAADRNADAEGFSSLTPLTTGQRFFPGSTAKVITSAAVYDLEPSLDNFSYPDDAQDSCLKLPNSDRSLCNDGTTTANSKPCGGTMVQMLPSSCDPGYGQLGLMLQGKLTQQADSFGFNSVPPIDLPFVTPSSYPSPDRISGSNAAYAALSAIGQYSVQATALQNAMVAATIANGGLEMVPHVLSQIRQSDGSLVKAFQPAVYQRPVSAQTAAQITSLMQGVVTSPDGTAARVGFAKSLDAAVKTGTAQTGDGSSSSSSNVDWMIGFAPANNPVIAVAVVVPEQDKASDGAGVAGPIMNAMLSAAVAHGG